MTGDITYQFIDYLAYFKTIVLSGNDLSYTFSKTMGGDMAGFASYYLSSPFNFILIFFPNRLLPLGLLIIIMVKSGCMSLFFEIMLNGIFGFRRRSVIFAVSYALMGYAVVYFQLYAYYDDMMLLPLIVLGIHRLIANPRDKVLYVISLSLAIILNYYIGWMLCIFSALYFVYRYLTGGAGKGAIVSFFISSLLSGAMSTWIVLPAVLSLRGEKDSFHLGFYRTMELSDLFSRFYTDSFKGNISTCLPNVYCGVLVCVLVAFYFLNKNIAIRERLLSLGFVVFLAVNFYINTLNVIWHGLNRPIGFPYRYSFLLTFMLLLLAYRCSLEFDVAKLPLRLLVMWGIYAAYSSLILIKGSDVVGKREILLDALLLFLISAALLFYIRRNIPAWLLVVLLATVQLADITENIRYSFYHFELADMGEYQRYVDRVGEIIDKIKEKDDGFYRIEKTFRRTHNDSMQFDYAGLTHYSSCEKKDVIAYMKKLGFRDNGNWAFYDGGSTALVDSIFGIKYIVSHYDYTGKKYKRSFNRKYEDEYGKEKYFIYKNKTALPLMFVSEPEVTGMDTSDENPFEFQNKLADAISGEENHMFTPAAYERRLVNLTEKTEGGVSAFVRTVPDEEAYIEYGFTVTNRDNGKLLEGYFDAPDYQNARVEMNGDDKGEYFSEYHWNILDLSRHDTGDEISIRIIPQGDELRLSGSYIYYEDMVRFKGWRELVASRECSLSRITSSHLKGYAWLPEDGQIVFSFPYEEDWTVYIDGVKAETEKAAGLLLSAASSAGVHKVELIYTQAGRPAGFLISIAGLLAFALMYLYKH